MSYKARLIGEVDIKEDQLPAVSFDSSNLSLESVVGRYGWLGKGFHKIS